MLINVNWSLVMQLSCLYSNVEANITRVAIAPMHQNQLTYKVQDVDQPPRGPYLMYLRQPYGMGLGVFHI